MRYTTYSEVSTQRLLPCDLKYMDSNCRSIQFLTKNKKYFIVPRDHEILKNKTPKTTKLYETEREREKSLKFMRITKRQAKLKVVAYQ